MLNFLLRLLANPFVPNHLRFLGGRRSDEGDLHGEVVEPGDEDCVVREAGLDQDRIVGAASDAHLDALRTDLDACGGVDELARQRAGLG